MRKRVSALLVLAFLLSGCGENDLKKETTDKPVETTQSVESTDTTKAKDSDTTKPGDEILDKANKDTAEAGKDEPLRVNKVTVIGENNTVAKLISEDGKTLSPNADASINQLKGTQEKVKNALDYLNSTQDNLQEKDVAIEKLKLASEKLEEFITSCEKNGSPEEKLEKAKVLKEAYGNAVKAIMKVTKV